LVFAADLLFVLGDGGFVFDGRSRMPAGRAQKARINPILSARKTKGPFTGPSVF